MAWLGLACLAVAAEGDFKGTAMIDCSGSPCVEIGVTSGAHIKMLIDTGNVRSILDKGVAQKLGLDIKPFVDREGKVHQEYYTATLSEGRIGERSLGDISVLVADLATGIKVGNMPNADGLLSYTAFGARLLRMDYKRHRVEVSDAVRREGRCSTDCGTLSNPTFGRQGPPILVSTGFTVNGRPLSVQIDTLFEGSMLIYPTAVYKLGLSTQQRSKRFRTFSFTDGGVQMIQGIASTEGFGSKILARDCPVYFVTPGVHAPDGMFDGTVGNALFVGQVLTFDFLNQRFWISG